MRVSANSRIQWLHEELVRGTFPNAARLAERFGISRRQAQRDIDFLKKQLGAPIEYDQRIMGYRYAKPFTLPVSVIPLSPNVIRSSTAKCTSALWITSKICSNSITSPPISIRSRRWIR